MAKVEMDLSEFKRMEQTEKDLRISLEKEEELRKEIQKLQKEKLEALKASKMKVSKVQRIKRTDVIRTMNPLSHFNNRNGINTVHSLFLNIRDAWGEYSHQDMMYALHELSNLVFKTERVTTEDSTATFHGLDEVKAELKEQLKDEMDEETRINLKAAENTIKRNDKLLPENKELRAEINVLKDLTSKQLKEIDWLKEDKGKIYDQLITKNEELEKLVILFKTESTLFNKGKIIRAAKKIIFKKPEN
jgi:hypothetical protein